MAADANSNDGLRADGVIEFVVVVTAVVLNLVAAVRSMLVDVAASTVTAAVASATDLSEVVTVGAVVTATEIRRGEVRVVVTTLAARQRAQDGIEAVRGRQRGNADRNFAVLSLT